MFSTIYHSNNIETILTAIATAIKQNYKLYLNYLGPQYNKIHFNEILQKRDFEFTTNITPPMGQLWEFYCEHFSENDISNIEKVWIFVIMNRYDDVIL